MRNENSYDFRASIKPKGPYLNVDLDGCIYDFQTQFDEKLAQGRSFHSICRDEGMFRRLPLIEGAKEAILELDEIYEIYFVSTPMYSNPSSYADKMLCLRDDFGKIAKKKLILTHNKGRVDGDFLIDDRIANGVVDFKGFHIHFGSEEFPNWGVVKKFLLDEYAKTHN